MSSVVYITLICICVTTNHLDISDNLAPDLSCLLKYLPLIMGGDITLHGCLTSPPMKAKDGRNLGKRNKSCLTNGKKFMSCLELQCPLLLYVVCGLYNVDL